MSNSISFTNNELLGPQIDITGPIKGAEVLLREDGQVLWVNVDGICRLRIGRLGETPICIAGPMETGGDARPIVRCRGPVNITCDPMCNLRMSTTIISKHPNFAIGDSITTSHLLSIDLEKGIAKTRNTIYTWET